MKSLYLRIWLTVVAALALFALVSGWMWQRHLDEERARVEQSVSDRQAAWAELLQRALPAADAPPALQAEMLREWSARLRVPLALDDAQGRRIGASDSFLRREAEGGAAAVSSVRLDDGRTLWMVRRPWRRIGPLRGPVPGEVPLPGEPMPPPAGMSPWPGPGSSPDMHRGPPPGMGPGPGGERADAWMPGVSPGPRLGPGLESPPPATPPLLFGLSRAVGPLVLVALLFVAVAAGAYPVVRRLTRRLEALKQGVAQFGAGDLGHRVDAAGNDEVAAVAATFNRSAERIEALVRSHKSLLANASHELRSPLARLKMAAAMLRDMPESQRAQMVREIDTNIAELDALVEEVLLASRLDAASVVERNDRVDLLGIAAEEAARVGAEVAAAGDEAARTVTGNERLLRRALRNLLENARRYGGDQVLVAVDGRPGGGAELRVCDRGPGVPPEHRERIFEPYFRLPGHAEREGGVGLGLSLVRQIADLHHGRVRCEPRDGGGTVFVLTLPAG